MKKLFENWKNYVIKEENEIDVPSTDDMGGSSPNSLDIMREYLKEIQDMAVRLVEMQDELKEKYKDGQIGYYPGPEFRVTARNLADEGYWGSLANNLNRWIENETKMPILQQQYKDKLEK